MCTATLKSKEYEKHCKQFHNLNSRLACVWCRGKVSWSSKEKKNHADHLLECWKKFLVLNTSLPETPDVVHTPFDMTPLCPSRDFFGRSLLTHLPRRAYYDTLCPLPLNPPALTFQDNHLNLAVSWVQKYLEVGEDSDWFHIMVRGVAMLAFLEHMDQHAGSSIHTLPFSCWCDGGKEDDACYRQHRHMIVMARPKGIFKQTLWHKIVVPPEARPHKHLKCIASKRIESPMHLVNAMGYLSQRRSRCQFSFDDTGPLKEKWNHYMIHTTLPVDYRLALVTQWDGGLLELIHQKYKCRSANDLVHVPMTFSDSRWRIQVGDLPDIPLHVTLPLSDCFQWTPFPTDTFLHLTQGKRIYFKQIPRDPSMPLENRVFFFDAVREAWWTPTLTQQKCLDVAKPVFDHKSELEKKLKLAEQEVSLVNQKLTLSEQVVSSVNQKLTLSEQVVSSVNQKLKLAEQEVGSLNQKLTLSEQEVGSLKEKLTLSEHQNVQLERENKILLVKLNDIYEKEIARLTERALHFETLYHRSEERALHFETLYHRSEERALQLEREILQLREAKPNP